MVYGADKKVPLRASDAPEGAKVQPCGQSTHKYTRTYTHTHLCVVVQLDLTVNLVERKTGGLGAGGGLSTQVRVRAGLQPLSSPLQAHGYWQLQTCCLCVVSPSAVYM